MRKIYSIVLTACALLVSASLFAETKNVSVSDWATLKSTIESAQAGDVVNITVAQSINADGAAPVRIYASKDDAAGIIVNLDMNGKEIIAQNMKRVFELYRGTLNVKGSGKITAKEYGTNSVVAFFVAGYSSQTVSNWSHLIINKDITVDAPGSNICGYAISVNEVQVYSQSKTVKDGNYPIADDVDVSAHFNDLGITFTHNTTSYSWMDYTTEWYTTSNGSKLGGKKATAYGVVVDVYGTVHASKYAVKVNGNINSKPAAAYMKNLPTINVYPGAKMLADNAKKSVAIYASGYANYNIQGTIQGATGVYVKSGNVTLENADIASTYSGDYVEITEGKKSGVQAGGSGVVIESNPSYCGGQDVKITGDTKIQATSGYAVEENITTPDNSTKMNALTIEGGTLIAGGKGTVVVTQQTLDDNDVVISVAGGNFDGDGKFQVKDVETGETVSAEVKDFLPDDNYFTTTVVDANNKEVTVVTNGTGFGSINKADENSVKTTTSGAIVWNNTTTTTETIDLDALTAGEKTDNNTRTLSYLEINNTYNQTLIIDGVTLKVGRIVMGKNAQIIVNAGARLIVDGAQGIVAPVASNIVLKTQEGNPAIFLFNPAVISNRHPNATVEFASKAYTREKTGEYASLPDNQRRVYQFFGSPMSNVESVTTDKPAYTTYFDIWNRTKYDYIGAINGDKAIDYSMFANKFGFYAITATNPSTDLQTYTFKGQLVGNEEAELSLLEQWSSMANAYMGQMDLEAMWKANKARRANGSNVAVAVYIYELQGNEIHWVANNDLQHTITKLNPMQPFLMFNPGAKESIQHSYNDLVWTPATTSNAPARRNIAADMTKATIRVNGNGMSDMVTIAESAEFTAELDELDAVMYPNTDINLYAMAAEKMSVLATDDVENTYIGFACPKGGEFTLTFAGVEGNALTLIDLKNNTAVDMTEGATYTFTAAANEANDYRFQIVGRRNAATALENTDAAVKAEGIYTLTGMYLGNMSVWNTLPAGIYVVNGEKMVK